LVDLFELYDDSPRAVEPMMMMMMMMMMMIHGLANFKL
jgi:hypothetical protein